ncbi:uncharacterized protein proca1 [Parambassis ranga]|uniref:phospholipase A2 n=1 Tax=Parambassis ranga TaxID=210632 RepID=A0A6P7JG13_9TELE|nr:protein PROCA1 [Parambassis ranga]
MWSVFFVFLSYLDRNVVRSDFLRALDAEKESKEMFSMLNSTLCAKMSIVGENFLYQVSDGAEVVRSVVSPAGKLVGCSVIVNQMQVKSFMHECRLGLKEKRATRQLETRYVRMDEAKLMCREFKERSERSGRVRQGDSGESALQDKTLKRSKRGFTYPGTLWCGAGNMADTYDQLGEFADTDSCCRTHDHCSHVIHAFSTNYGYTNFKWYPICHCDCDNAMKACLRKVNDTSSRVVGQAFFNVIGVPCFELAYEEQCAERHWYGMCKRYEKLPLAVMQNAVPYDFGGIDVIDELTLAPPKSKDSKKSSEEEKTESPTQSTISGPEEPSLRNVVTAAEDFIKVLATVSTSQSSSTDSEKGEAQGSEKKKRKNKGKKKKPAKKQKGKGKGRKRKQKADTVVKLEEGAAVSPSASKAEEVNALSNFISEVHRHDQPSRKPNGVSDSEYDLAGKDEPNQVMKDEQAPDRETAPITAGRRMPAKSHTGVKTEGNTLCPSIETVIPNRRQRKGRRRKKSWKTPLPCPEVLVTNTTDDTRAASVASIITISPTARPEPQSFSRDTEKRPVVSAASSPIVILKVKRNRSKERGDTEERKKRRKASSATAIVPLAQQNSSVDNLKVIPPTGAPTAAVLIPTTVRQLSHRPDVYSGRIQVTTVNSSFSVLKRQRSKERGLRNRRRKMPPSSASHSSSDNVPPVPTTPDMTVSLNLPAVAEETETPTEWRLFTTAASTISTKRHWQRPRKKAAVVGGSLSVPKQTVTLTTTPANVATTQVLRSEKPRITTSAAPVISPLQISIEKARAQFTRKKRRKAASFSRQQ